MEKSRAPGNNRMPLLPKPFTRSDKAFIEALSRMLEQKPFSDIHVMDLVREAGFSKGAFYRQHEDKYYFARDIVTSLAQTHGYYLRVHSNLRMQGLTVDSFEIRQWTKGTIGLIYKNRELYSMVIDNKLPHAGFDEFISIALDYGFGTQGEYARDSFFAYVTISTSLAYVNFWKLNGFRIPPDEMAQLALGYEGYAYDSLPAR